jgi:hypothetical protein
MVVEASDRYEIIRKLGETRDKHATSKTRPT